MERRYINPYIGGVVLGVVLFLSFFLTGGGLGASGAVSRVQVGIFDLVASFHVDTNIYFTKMGGGTLNSFDSASVWMLIGTFLGGLISGFFNKRLKFETRKGSKISNKTRWIMAFIGGAIMGFGARLSKGCTSGQGLSGGAVMAVGSWVFMFSLFATGFLFAYFFRKFWEE